MKLTAMLAAISVVCATPAAAGERKFSVMLDWTPSALHSALYWADEKEMFKAQGLDLEIVSPSDPTTPLKLVATGNVDLAISYTTEAILASEQGLPVVVVGSMVPRPLVAIMAPSSSGITSTSDLKGRKIGYSGIPTYKALLDAMIENAGLLSGDVEIVNVGYNIVPAVLSGAVDAIGDGFINDQAAQLEQHTGAKPFVQTVDSLGVPSYDESVFVAERERLLTDPAYKAQVRAFLTAFYDGVADANVHPGKATALMERVTNREIGYLEVNVPLSLALMRPEEGKIGCLDAGRYDVFSDWMVRMKLISGKPLISALIDNSNLPHDCN